MRSRPVRADAQQNVARILEAAQVVFAKDPNATLEQVAEQAGLARTTVHRRFSSRQVLLAALVNDLNARYSDAFERARVSTAPPMVALYRLTEMAFELKVSHPFVTGLIPSLSSPGSPALVPEIQEGLDLLFARLHAAGQIAVDDPPWCRRLYLVLLHQVHELSAEAPVLRAGSEAPDDEVGARVRLLVETLLGALGGRRQGDPAPSGR